MWVSVSMNCWVNKRESKTSSIQEAPTAFSSQIRLSIHCKTHLPALIRSTRHSKLLAKPKPPKRITTSGGTPNILSTLWSTGGLRCGKRVLCNQNCQITSLYWSSTFSRETKMKHFISLPLTWHFQRKAALLQWLKTFSFLTSCYVWPVNSPMLLIFFILNNSFWLYPGSKSGVGHHYIKPVWRFSFLERQVHHFPNLFSCPFS